MDVFKKRKIHFYTTQDPSVKASLSERVIRTLKQKYHYISYFHLFLPNIFLFYRIYKYMTANKTQTYIEKLNEIVDSYNNSIHRSIGMSPKMVNYNNQHLVFKKLYPEFGKKLKIKFKYEIGQRVRVALEKTVFSKGYQPQFSKEIYYVFQRLPRDPPVYRLKTVETDETVLGVFYEQEVVPINDDQINV